MTWVCSNCKKVLRSYSFSLVFVNYSARKHRRNILMWCLIHESLICAYLWLTDWQHLYHPSVSNLTVELWSCCGVILSRWSQICSFCFSASFWHRRMCVFVVCACAKGVRFDSNIWCMLSNCQSDKKCIWLTYEEAALFISVQINVRRTEYCNSF